jgi:hypothetical protein
MTRLLDLLALRWDFAWRVLVGIGIVFAAYYWLQLTTTTGAPVDVHAYWAANPDHLYPDPSNPLSTDAYLYAPAFEVLVGWGRHLPFEAFVAIWRGILLAVMVWLAGPVAGLVVFAAPVASEINAGNIQMLLAAAIVLGFRGVGGGRVTLERDGAGRPADGAWWPAAWAFVLLTKVTPGVGLLWFALRREWRPLGIALGATAAITAVTFAIWADRWLAWLNLLVAGGSPPPLAPYYLPFVPRLAVAVGIVVIAAWRGWRWPVVVAAMLALPAFYFLSPSILVGVLPFARQAAGRWLARRRAEATERLRAQATPEVGAIVAG